MLHETTINQTTNCYHCGDKCPDNKIKINDFIFCCSGCKMVYEIINKQGLCNYYDIEKNPGTSQKFKVREGKFAFLDNPDVINKLLDFSDKNQSRVTFYLPQMHCSSCIWLLENLNKINKSIIKSQVNFLKKEINVVYQTSALKLRELAELIVSIGYEPHINLNDISAKTTNKHNKSAIFKIGVAGFCFGNIMMLSFPEYFSFGNMEDESLKKLFSYLNLFLALPVFFYSASEFFVSSWKSIKQKFLNIDAPIALAILITFVRSVVEILSGSGAGYLDSMSGIVFFMLLGRYFQNRTYDNLSFDRDYKSYFPIGITVIAENGTEKEIPVPELKTGHRIKIRNGEIIPADSILFLGKAQIDYSFVTGESLPVDKSIGEIIYAGGKQKGEAIELEVIKEVSQSYLTQLWNNDVFKEDKSEKKKSFIHALSRYFTYVLFSIVIVSAVYWKLHDPTRILNSVTAILIVACPCALLLSATFTNGNFLRILNSNAFYVKNENALERIAQADTIVFDKTGTITEQKNASLIYYGADLNSGIKALIRSLAMQSNHPLSKAIVSCMPFSKTLPVKKFKEVKGKGIQAYIEGHFVQIGSADFLDTNRNYDSRSGSRVYIAINNTILGCYVVKNKYRDGLSDVVSELKKKYKLVILSGDNNSEEAQLLSFFDSNTLMFFNQKPEDKLEYIKLLQKLGRKVIMVGDGLNDAGALKQSDAGIVIADNVNNFSPACDAILSGDNFQIFHKLLTFCRKQKSIITGSFIISVFYNIIGLFFAVQGTLEPVIAAILMPISSVSIMLYTTGMSSIYGLNLKHKQNGNTLIS